MTSEEREKLLAARCEMQGAMIQISRARQLFKGLDSIAVDCLDDIWAELQYWSKMARARAAG